MLPAKNSAHQGFGQTPIEPARLRTVGNTTPHISPAPQPANEEQLDFGISFDVNDQEEMQRAKKEIVTMVSHDLRSPLTALRVSVGMFLGGAFGDLPPEAIKRLESMGTSVDLLIRMINDLLDIEKFEAGQFRFYVKPAATSDLVNSAVQAVSGIAESKKVSIKVSGKKLNIEVDGDRVIQVLINILSNAIKFSPAHSQIEVRTSVHDGFAEFRVIDHGKGIPAAHLPNVFRPFEQLDAHDIERTGSGLGLTICKKIIEAHGGSIGVDSEVGKGSQFWFRLKISN